MSQCLGAVHFRLFDTIIQVMKYHVIFINLDLSFIVSSYLLKSFYVHRWEPIFYSDQYSLFFKILLEIAYTLSVDFLFHW